MAITLVNGTLGDSTPYPSSPVSSEAPNVLSTSPITCDGVTTANLRIPVNSAKAPGMIAMSPRSPSRWSHKDMEECGMKDSNIAKWTDLQLLEAIRDGVPLAQRILYERHAAYAITEFKSYLAAAIVNRCRKILARQPEQTVSLDADLLLYLEKAEPNSVSMLDDLSGKAEHEILVRTMNKCLSPHEFQAVDLHYFHDYSYGEIAKILGKTEGRVRQITHRALKTLRKEL